MFYFRIGEKGVRHIALSTSADFRTWTKGQSIDLGNSPREHLYTNATIPYFRAPHVYLAFPMRFLKTRPPLAAAPRGGVCDGVFMFSRDGLHFNRRYMEAFLRPGPEGQNWNKHSIDYDELLAGGPPRDGIPSIDEPVFISPDEAAEWLADNEPVIALEIDGDARAYPLQILTWHEIANDVVGDVPVAVTFCPLCNSAITFDRRLNGETYEFGTSGLLRHSDLVMYDRTTEGL